MDVKTMKDCIIDEEWEKTPDMGEYLDNNLISKMATDITDGKVGGEYFMESPFSLQLGYHQAENAFVLSGKPSYVVDGDTIGIKFSEIQDGNKAFVFMGDDKAYNNVKEFLYNTSDVKNTEASISLRLVGINAPEVPHCQATYVSKEAKSVYVRFGDILSKSNVTLYEDKDRKKEYKVVARDYCSVVYFKYETNVKGTSDIDISYVGPRDENDMIELLVAPAKDETGTYTDFYYEITKKNCNAYIEGDIDLPKYCICVAHSPGEHKTDQEYHKQALEEKATVKELIDKASDIIYVVDGTSFKHQKDNIPFEYWSETDKLSSNPFYAFGIYYDLLTGKEKSYSRLGYRYFGQDYNQRNLAAVYIKYKHETYGEIWINLAKYLAFMYDKTETLPAYTSSPSNESNFNYNSSAFKMWSYDKDKQVFVDSMSDFYSEMGGDDRAEIQKEITGCDMEQLKDYTVMIGDCLLIVPPTSIRLVSQTNSQRTSLIRAKGAITKSLPKTERIIEMQLYFNGEDAINGIEYEQALPNGETRRYYMNGLRALVAQFKFTPYLPIENTFLNQVLNIEAVSLNSIQINTVPNFPRTIQATIRLQDFEYRQLMPEILPPDVESNEDLTTNLFAKTIHFPVMRYYYQRAIQRGEDVKNLEYNSEAYLNATIGQRTTLQPMKFKSPLINFYIANEEHLKMRKQLKEALEKKPFETVVTYTDKEKDFLKEVAKMYSVAVRTLYNGLDNINKINNDYNDWEYNDSNITILNKDYNEYTFEKAYSSESNSFGFRYRNMNNKKFYNEYIVPIENNFKTFFNNKNDFDPMIIGTYYMGCREVAKGKNNIDILYGLKLKINWEKGGPNLLNKVKQDYGKSFACNTDYLLVDGCIIFGYSASIQNKKMSKSFTICEAEKSDLTYINADISLLSKLSNDFTIQIDDDGNVVSDIDIDGDDLFSQNQELAEMKDNIDLETDKSMIFDEFPLGNPIITNVSIIYNNNFNKMSLNAMDGFVSQYIGANDTMLEIEMQTKDEATINSLQMLPRACADRLINYRKIMTCSPLRIDCEMARMFGINEVIIESIDINTVPNFPGLYNVSMRLMSVDRTLRNREALKKLDLDTSKYNNDSTMQAKNFFEVKDTFAKVELYPDLELPTLDEMAKLGYYFIRYKNEENRVFPDADFYFVYLHAYSSEMLRESIISFFNDDANKQLLHEVTDNMGGGSQLVNLHLKNDDDNDKTLLSQHGEDTTIHSEAIEKVYDNIEEVLKYTSQYADEESLQAIEKQMKDNLDRKNIMLELQENLESFNYSTYDFNHYIKIGVKDEVPFTKYGKMINEDEINTIDSDGNLTKKKVDDVVKETNHTIKELIRGILGKPIDEKGSGIITKDFERLIDYIAKDILELDGYNYVINEKGQSTNDLSGVVNSIQGFLNNKLRVALSSGATGEGSILDYYKEENKNKDKWIGRASINRIDSDGTEHEDENILTTSNGQGISGYVALDKNMNKYEDGIVYGPFAIKKYSAKFLGMIYNCTFVDKKDGFIDPYYNEYVYNMFFESAIKSGAMPPFDSKRVEEYIDGISNTKWDDKENINKVSYATIAMYRIILVWFYKLLDDEKQSYLPTSFYVLRNISKVMANIDENKHQVRDFIVGGSAATSGKVRRFLSKTGDKIANTVTSVFGDDNDKITREIESEQLAINNQTEAEFDDMIKDIKTGLQSNKINLICGLFTTLGALALTGFNSPIYSAVVSGNLGDITDYLEQIKSSYIDYEDLNETDLTMRRFISYLDYEEYKNKNNWKSFINPLRKYSSASRNQRIYLKAADIPQIYLLHSFYDMVMHDMRGRMARAFPTYYMLLIDEGRDLGMWHLQDNFYDVSSISEFQVVKSRKIAADTASITMTNLFGTFTSEDEDMKDEYVYTFKDAFNSIFSPRSYYEKEYSRRKNAREFNRAKLKPGARVHLRMGYDGDASKLPIVFNGCVSEVQTLGDMIKIICQGDGVELANPDMFNPADVDDVADLKYSEDMFGGLYGMFDNNSTPRDILVSPLIASGSWIQSLIRKWSDSRFFNSNPFGIVHFGDKYYKDIFTMNGEVEQNIYEAINKPSWNTSGKVSFNESLWEMEKAPEIRVGLSNKSYWDLMNTAAAVSPDFICAIAPFNLRSTIFYGAPRYYYAYDYEKTTSGKVVERRKPYQQYHIYTSYTDIIANKVTASDKDVRTCAIGVYKGPNWLTSTTKTVGPMYIDIDIYPEYQKMTTINCDFEYRNTDLPFTLPVIDKVTNDFTQASEQIAWRATATGLKNTVRDMYTGELIVIGDPTVKPYDKIMLYDTYEDMQGIAEVEAVVHTFSIETGFTTSITPDCISAIDDKYEKISHSAFKGAVLPAITNFVTVVVLSTLFSKVTRSIYLSAAQATKSGVKFAEKFINNIKSVINPEELTIFSKYSDDILGTLGYAFDATPTDYKIYTMINDITKNYSKLVSSHSFSSATDIVSMLGDMKKQSNILSGINPIQLKTELQEALKNTSNFKPGAKAEMEKAISELDDYIKAYNSANTAASSIFINSDEITAILEAAKKSPNASEIKASIDYLEAIKDSKLVASASNFDEAINHLSIAASKIDDLGPDAADLLKTLQGVDSRVFGETSSTLKKFDTLEDTLSGVNKVKKGAGAIKATVASNLLWLAAQIVITKYAQEYLEKKLKNLQVLTIFPLMKNNMVLTAGLNGNKGSVFDSPTYNTPGFIEQMAIDFFDGKYGKALPFITDCLINTTDMREIVDNYRRDSEYDYTNGSSDTQNQEMVKKLQLQVTKDEALGVDAYRQLFLVPRVSSPKSTEGILAYKNSSFTNIPDLSTNKRIDKELRYIFSDPYLNQFNSSDNLDRRVLLFAAQQNASETDKNGNSVGTCDIKIKSNTEGAKDIIVKAKKIDKGTRDLPVYDIPYLRLDALTVLRRIVQEVIDEIQPDATSENSTLEELHKHNIIIHNCTRVNEKTSWFNTGYEFTIQVKDYDNFGNILKRLSEDQQIIVNSNNEPAKLWSYDKDSSMGDNTYKVMVFPAEE